MTVMAMIEVELQERDARMAAEIEARDGGA